LRRTLSALRRARGTADDYAMLAERILPCKQPPAHWLNGSWYDALVAVDPFTPKLRRASFCAPLIASCA